MSEPAERQLGDLTVRIDRTLCVGFGDCVDEAGDVFAMDSDEIAVFRDPPGSAQRETLIKACEACPVDALEVWNSNGEQLVP